MLAVCAYGDEEPKKSAAPLAVPAVLDLTAAQQIALSGNPGLHAAETRITQARQRVRQVTSFYFPQVTGSLSLSKTRFSQRQLRETRAQILGQQMQAVQGQFFQSQSFGGGGAFSNLTLANTAIQTVGLLDIDETSEAYGAQIAATWILFDGFEREFTRRAARIAHRESKAGYEEAQRLILSAVAGAFYEAQLAEQTMAIADADRDFNERLLREAEARERVGAGSLSDVLNFQVQVNQAQASRISAARRRGVALVGLAELMGVPDASFGPDQDLAPMADETADELVLPDGDAMVAYAEAHRPDLAQREYAVDRLKAAAKARRGPFYPSVTASLSHDALRTDDWDIDSDDFQTTLGLTVSYSFFAGGRNLALLREAKAARSEAEWNFRAAELMAAREVHGSLENLQAAQESLQLQRENATLVRRNRDLVEKGYLVGQESLVRLTQAERDFITAEFQLAQALVSLRLAWHDLRTATGETVEGIER
jgi:outer membrane protein TolC